MSLVNAPAEIQGFVEWAVQNGMQLLGERVGDSVSCVFDFADEHGQALHVLCDRGQWFVEVGRQQWNDWFDADVWTACLEQTSIDREGTESIAQVAVLRARWFDMARAPDSIRECLERTRKYRACRRLGLPGPVCVGGRDEPSGEEDARDSPPWPRVPHRLRAGDYVGRPPSHAPGTPRSRGFADHRDGPSLAMARQERALAAIREARSAVEVELQRHRAGAGTVGTPFQLESVASQLARLEREVTTGPLRARDERDRGMGHMVNDSWPLGSALAEAVLAAEDAYLKL